eukprot:TRINITY_DN10362_c0_g1_i1.p1 TRINITY_DN10362_c0_g1~~TRINITY_DN10362_c0_g1_i1.p1  ORF type:complete len:1021 (+),score=48.21 TRINITY_DN10362_c0_g1_i1:91-3153(+)
MREANSPTGRAPNIAVCESAKTHEAVSTVPATSCKRTMVASVLSLVLLTLFSVSMRTRKRVPVMQLRAQVSRIRSRISVALERGDIAEAAALRNDLSSAEVELELQIAAAADRSAVMDPAGKESSLQLATSARRRAELIKARRAAEEREDYAEAEKISRELTDGGNTTAAEPVRVPHAAATRGPTDAELQEAGSVFESAVAKGLLPRASACKRCQTCVLAKDVANTAPATVSADGDCERCLCTHVLTQLTPGTRRAGGGGPKLDLDSGATQSAAFTARGHGGWRGVFKIRPTRIRKGQEPVLWWSGATPEEAGRLRTVVQECGIGDLFAEEWSEPLETALPWPDVRTDTRFWPWLSADMAGATLNFSKLAFQAVVHGVSIRMYLEQAVHKRSDGDKLLSFIHGLNSTAFLRIAVFDLLTSQGDRHQEHIFVGADGNTQHPVTIDSSTTVFNYGKLSHMMLPGTFYHERAHIGQYFGTERKRSFQNPNLWPFDFRCHLPKVSALGTDYRDRGLLRCMTKFANATEPHSGLTTVQSTQLRERASEMLTLGFEETLRRAGRTAFRLMYGQRYFPEGMPPDLWPTGHCCRIQSPRGQCVQGSAPRIPQGYPPAPGEPGAVEYWKRFGKDALIPTPPPAVPRERSHTAADAKGSTSLWVWTTHTCVTKVGCQIPNRVSSVPVDWQSSVTCGGSGHSICVDPKGRVLTWGRNDSRGGGKGGTEGVNDAGQLGRGGDIRSAGLVPGIKAVFVAAGRYHSAAVGNDGAVYTWGMNDYGQLGRAAVDGCVEGTGCRDGVPRVVQSTQGRGVVRVAAGRYFTVAVTSGGAVLSWGRSACGQQNGKLPDPANLWRTVSVVDGGVSFVDAGYVHWIAVMNDGRLHTCGTLDDGYGRPREPNGDGELGRGGPATQLLAESVLSRKVRSAAAGRCFTVALTADGTVQCWGCRCGGSRGSVATGLSSHGDLPAAVYASEYAVAAVTQQGDVLQWVPTGSGTPQHLQRWSPSWGKGQGRTVLAAGYQHFVVFNKHG